MDIYVNHTSAYPWQQVLWYDHFTRNPHNKAGYVQRGQYFDEIYSTAGLKVDFSIDINTCHSFGKS